MSSFENFRPVRMRRFIMTWTRHVETYTRRAWGFEMPESRLIWLLGRSEAVTAKALCGPALMEKSQVSRSISKLRALGYVTGRANPADGRSELLLLTAKGRTCFERLLSLSLRWADWTEGGLDAAEQAVLDDILGKLQTRVEALGKVVERDLQDASLRRTPQRRGAALKGAASGAPAGAAKRRQREGEVRTGSARGRSGS